MKRTPPLVLQSAVGPPRPAPRYRLELALKSDLEPGKERLLVGAVGAAQRAAVEVRDRVIEIPTDILGQVPIQAHRPGSRLARLCIGVGEPTVAGAVAGIRECSWVELELADSRRQFDSAPARLTGDIRPLRRHGPEGRIVAGERIRGEELPTVGF